MHAFWKVAALLTVIGTGCVGVYQVQRNLAAAPVRTDDFLDLGDAGSSDNERQGDGVLESDTLTAPPTLSGGEDKYVGSVRGQNHDPEEEWAPQLDQRLLAANPGSSRTRVAPASPARGQVQPASGNDDTWADVVPLEDPGVVTADLAESDILDTRDVPAVATPKSKLQPAAKAQLGKSPYAPVLMQTPKSKSAPEVRTVAGERTRGPAANAVEPIAPVTPEQFSDPRIGQGQPLGSPGEEDFGNLQPLEAPAANELDGLNDLNMEPPAAQEPAALDTDLFEPQAGEPAPIEPSQIELDNGFGAPDGTPTRTLDSPLRTPAGRSTLPDSLPQRPVPSPLNASDDPRTPRTLDLRGNAPFDPTAPSGPQQPELKIEKLAPQEATVGEEMVYVIRVQNVGQSAAHRIRIEDGIPLGTTLIGSDPQAMLPAANADSVKRLVWEHIDSLAPGEAQEIKVKVRPDEAGSVGSVATVSFAAAVAATTVVNSPNLQVSVSGQQEAIIGEQVPLRLRVTNRGTGTAKGVMLVAGLGELLTHPSLQQAAGVNGNSLDYEIGTLGPNQSKEVDLVLIAVKDGDARPTFAAEITGNSQSQVQESHDVSILPSRLHVTRSGPGHRFVGRAAEYQCTTTNLSRIKTLQNVTIVERLPAGLEPTGEAGGARWDAQNRLLSWQVAQLGPGQQVNVKYTLVPKQAGDFAGIVQASDVEGNKASVETQLDVAGFASLVVDMHNNGTNVAVGDQVSLRLTLKNQGTASAKQVEAVFEIPPELKYVNSNPPQQVVGRTLSFSVDRAVPPGEDVTFDIVLQAAAEGNVKVKAELYTADNTEPFKSESPVRIYRDAPSGSIATPNAATGAR